MDQKVCYRVSDGLVVAVKNTDWQFGASETDGEIFKVATLNLNQVDIDEINDGALIISNTLTTGCWKVNHLGTPTNIEKVS